MRFASGAVLVLLAWVFWKSRQEAVAGSEERRGMPAWLWKGGSYAFHRWERWRVRRGIGDGGRKAALCGALYLGKSGREWLRIHEIRRWSLLLLFCGLAGVFGFLFCFQEPEGIVRTKLERKDVGAGSRKYELKVRGLGEDTEVEFWVDNQVLSDTKRLFEAAREEAEGLLFSGEDQADCVRGDLHFPSVLCEGLVSATWEPTEPKYIRYDGKVLTESLGAEGVVTEVKATFVYEEEMVTEWFALHLKPPVYTKEEEQLAALRSYLEEAEADSRTEETFLLPKSFEGQPLTFIEEAERVMPEQVLVCGLLIAVCVFLLADQRLTTQGRKREEQLKLDYPELVLKLTVLMRAGLTVRGAWERVVDGYLTMRKNGQKSMRYVYEEMLQTSLRMQGGLSEAEAYREFGKRTHLHAYLKLSGLLEQNIRKGSRGLVQLLEAESEEAWMQRKNVAKQKGEEAGTRLLIPMFLLLVLVMLLIMIPAVLSF